MRERMSTPQNRYYLRSVETASSGETTPDPNESSSSESSLGLSDLEDAIVTPEQFDMASNFHITLSPFHGNSGERADDEWLVWFTNYADAHGFNADKRRQTMPFFLKDHALTWYNSLTTPIKADFDQLTTAMKTRFNGSDGLDSDMALLTLTQQPGESCSNYFTRILKVTSNRQYPETLLTSIALKGLNANLKTIVMPQALTTLEDLRKAAMLAEKTVSATMAASIDVNDVTQRVLDAVTDKLSEVMAYSRGPIENRAQPLQPWSHQPSREPARLVTPQPKTGRNSQNHDRDFHCDRCLGRFPHSLHDCGSNGVTCYYCKKRNHFTETCFKYIEDLKKGTLKNH